jgi:dinuclear metal center YbgI/SA1388 family protein
VDRSVAKGRQSTAWPTLGNIVRFLNDELKVGTIRDSSKNGLQVRLRKACAVVRAGFAVDACMSTFEQAANEGVNLLVVHHGIRWRPQKDRDLEKKLEAWLQKNNMALYAVHLPLDLHREYGNNIGLARMLGVKDPKRFGAYHGVRIGYAGALSRTAGLDDLAAILTKQLKTSCRVLQFGTPRVRTVGIISGGGGSMFRDAVREGLDCFIVGEIDLATHNAAREYGMNLIVAGHYATETVGVRALMALVGKVFGIETVFIDDAKKW